MRVRMFESGRVHQGIRTRRARNYLMFRRCWISTSRISQDLRIPRSVRAPCTERTFAESIPNADGARTSKKEMVLFDQAQKVSTKSKATIAGIEVRGRAGTRGARGLSGIWISTRSTTIACVFCICWEADAAHRCLARDASDRIGAGRRHHHRRGCRAVGRKGSIRSGRTLPRSCLHRESRHVDGKLAAPAGRLTKQSDDDAGGSDAGNAGPPEA